MFFISRHKHLQLLWRKYIKFKSNTSLFFFLFFFPFFLHTIVNIIESNSMLWDNINPSSLRVWWVNYAKLEENHLQKKGDGIATPISASYSSFLLWLVWYQLLLPFLIFHRIDVYVYIYLLLPKPRWCNHKPNIKNYLGFSSAMEVVKKTIKNSFFVGALLEIF